MSVVWFTWHPGYWRSNTMFEYYIYMFRPSKEHGGRERERIGVPREDGEPRGEMMGDRGRGTRFSDSQQLFVGNLPHNVSEKELRQFFGSEFFNQLYFRSNCGFILLVFAWKISLPNQSSHKKRNFSHHEWICLIVLYLWNTWKTHEEVFLRTYANIEAHSVWLGPSQFPQ